MMDVTVCIATFGDAAWARLAAERALPSALAETTHVRLAHADTLAQARNDALAAVQTEWVVFLDADDELEPGYMRAMHHGAMADVRVPSVRYVTPRAPRGRPRMPRVAGHRHACEAGCLPEGNWVVIGAAARTELVQAAGGFRDWPVYEDWCLWLRMFLAGATFEAVPGAVYRAHARPDSRNRDGRNEDRVATHWAIHAAIYGADEEGTA